jgi:flagellar hook assembly protein FlgD
VLEFGITHTSVVSIRIYDLRGRRVRRLVDEVRDPGVYRALWDGADDLRRAMPAGVYLVRWEADGLRQNLKVVRAE